MTAKAGSSCRSKGKSRRKRVLNSAVMVSGGVAGVSRAVQGDPCAPHPAGGTFILVPDGEDTEDEGAEGGSEEAAPVVADSEEGGSDLDAEEDAWHRGEAHEGGGETQACPRRLACFPPRAHTRARPTGSGQPHGHAIGWFKVFPGKAYGQSPAGGAVGASERVA